MNDERSFERFVADNVAGQPVGALLPDDFYDDIHAQATSTRQRPEWLARIKEPPMRTNSHLAVGSPTARVAAIMVATLLLAVALAAAGVAGQRLLAADDEAIVVAQDGSGDYTTIGEAVEAAVDGDRIVIRPGDYVEAVVIDKDITLSGDGPREQITIRGHQDPELWAPGSECLTGDTGACALVLNGTTATLRGITFTGDNAGVKIVGGAPTVTGVLFDHVGAPRSSGQEGVGLAMVIKAGSQARILGNEFVASADLDILGRAMPLVEGNILRGGTQISADDPGDDTVIRANEISDAANTAISLHAATTLLIEDKVVTGADQYGIKLGLFSAIGIDPVIRGNTITDSGQSAINAVLGGTPTIEGNTLADNGTAMILGLGQAAVRANDIRGEGSGITVTRGSDPMITENSIDVTGSGITLGDGAWSTLSDNSVCGGEASISIHENAEPIIDDTNEICEDAPAE